MSAASGRYPEWNFLRRRESVPHVLTQEISMGFGKGALLWLLGVPLPIIILLALFMHH